MKKTLIAAAVLIAAPTVFAQSGSGSASGSANTNQNGNVPGVTVGGSAQGTPPAGASSQTGPLSGAGGFSVLDKNGDGSLSRDEIAGNAQLKSKFGTLDTDRNGSLSNAEFSKFESTATGSNSDNNRSTTDKVKDKANNLNSPSDVNDKIKDNNQPSDFKK